MSDILIINGPNLNLLGTREVSLYGSTTLADIEADIIQKAERLGYSCSCFQSNAEHELIERIHNSKPQGTRYVIINPAAFTHTSVAIRDALLGVAVPFTEVHLSNVYAREAFRKHSYFSDKADAVISGCGALGYTLALEFAAQQLKKA